jgi:hypothetical protein
MSELAARVNTFGVNVRLVTSLDYSVSALLCRYRGIYKIMLT